MAVVVQRRAAILAAAKICFTRTGFPATTIQDIAAEADISQGLLYRYFAGKRELIVALIEEYVAFVHAEVQRAPDLQAALQALFAETNEGAAGYGALLVQIMAEALRLPEVAEVVITADDAVVSALAAHVERAQQLDQAASQLPTAAVAEVAIALADGLALRAALKPERADDDALERVVTLLFDRLLAPS